MIGANFTGHPNQIDADRLDFWVLGLFGVGIAMSPISRVAMGALMLPAVCILLYRFFKTGNFRQIWAYRKTALGMAIIAIFSWFAFTSVFSLDVDKSIQVTFRTFVMIFIGAVLFQYCSARKGLALFGLKAGLYSFVTWALISNYFLYFNTPLFRELTLEWLWFPPQLVFFKNDGALALVFLAVALYLGLISVGIKRWLHLGCVVVLGLFIYAGGHEAIINKSAMAGNLLGLIAAFFFLGASYLSQLWRKTIVVIAMAGALFGTMALMEKLAPITTIGEAPVPILAYPDHHRQVIWSFVYDKFLQNPVFGVGIDAITKTEYAKTRLAAFGGQEYVPAHPHNWVLEIAVETGSLGIILVLTGLALFVIRLMDLFQQKNIDKKMIFALFYFFCSFWVISMAAFSIWSSWWLVSFFIATAMMLAVAKEKAPD